MPPARVAAQIAQRAHTPGLTGRAVARSRLHLTLAFLGCVDRRGLDTALAVGDMIQGRAFRLRLDQVGGFARAGIIWLAPDEPPAALLALSKKLYENTCARVDKRAFRPHITLTRKAGRLATRRVEPITWTVTDFSLIASGTAGRPGSYRELRRWPLLPAPVDAPQL